MGLYRHLPSSQPPLNARPEAGYPIGQDPTGIENQNTH